jgi:hypothetical protein
MKKYFWQKGLCWLLILAASCVEPYAPPTVSSPEKYLVVEGFLNSGNGSSSIRLSRTQNLKETGPIPVELKATVLIEGEQNTTYPFTEAGNGVYTLGALSFQNNEKYRLRIKTASGKQYLSDYVTIKQAPQLDSVFWEVENNGVQLYINASDPKNNTWYYRWDYQETWEFNVPYVGSLYYTRGKVDLVTENIATCWKGTSSNNIILGSSVRLSKDVIYKFPLIYLPKDSPKHLIKYSILVRQYGLNKESFEYWQNLKKNTENIGSLFDSQPSQVTGNIKSVDTPDEPVFGYFDAYTVQEKRIFIRSRDLPRWQRITGYESCELDTVSIPDLIKTGGNQTYMFFGEDRGITGQLEGYIFSSPNCMDCRTAGTNVKPSFW